MNSIRRSSREALEMDPAEVEERLESLERVHVFVRRGEELEFADGTLTLRYRFVHVLYQNVLYASLQPTRRAALSGRIVTALATHYGNDAPRHCRQARRPLRDGAGLREQREVFFTWPRSAPPRCSRFREALSLAERGLKGLRGLPDGPPRQQLELGLQLMRGLGVSRGEGLGGAGSGIGVRARARALPAVTGSAATDAGAVEPEFLPHDPRRSRHRARASATPTWPRPKRRDTDAYIMAMHHVAGVTAEFMGDFVESNQLLERARELHDPAQHRAYTEMFGMDPGMVARAMSARPLWALGQPDAALARSRETMALCRLAAPAGDARLLADRAAERAPVPRRNRRGDPARRRDHRDRHGIRIPAGGRVGPRRSRAPRSHSPAATDDGVAQLQRALGALQDLRSGLIRTMFLSLPRRCPASRRARRRRPRGGRRRLRARERTQERGFSAELHRLRGELLRLGGNRDAAQDSLRIALDVARQQQRPIARPCAPRSRSRGWNRARRARALRRAELASISRLVHRRSRNDGPHGRADAAVRDGMTESMEFERSFPPKTLTSPTSSPAFSPIQAQYAAQQNRPLARGTHAKGVCVRATFEVFDVAATIPDPALAARLARGLFAKPGMYPATVRFANAASTFNPDSEADVRAMSFSVEVPAGVFGPDPKRLDFSMNDATDVHDQRRARVCRLHAGRRPASRCSAS